MPKDVHGDLAAWHFGWCSWWRLLFGKIWFYFLFLHVYFSFFLISYTYSKAARRGESRKGDGDPVSGRSPTSHGDVAADIGPDIAKGGAT